MHRIGLVAARREVDIGADGKSDRADALGLGSNMHTDIREIGPERGLHLVAYRLRQRPTAATGKPKRPGFNGKRTAGPVAL